MLRRLLRSRTTGHFPSEYPCPEHGFWSRLMGLTFASITYYLCNLGQMTPALCCSGTSAGEMGQYSISFMGLKKKTNIGCCCCLHQQGHHSDE